MYKAIIFAAVALVSSVSSRYSTGTCGNPQLQENFDPNRYFGTWFQVNRDKDAPYENGYCEQARYSAKPDGTVKVFNS